MENTNGFIFSGDVLVNYRGAGGDVVIPEGVTRIGKAFCNCSSLTSVVIPESVTSIGESAFEQCENLTSVVIMEGVRSIEESAFKNCKSLTSVVIPKSMGSIGKSAFESCSSLTSVVIPEGVTRIERRAFAWCFRLTSVVIPKSVTSIGDSAFSQCSSLTSLVISEGMTSIGKSAFEWCSSLTSVVIPKGVTSIGESAFEYCHSLTSVVISEGVKSIGDKAFNDCRSLTSVVIPEGVTSIGDKVFSDCRSLTSVVIPEGVTSIGDSAFSNCSSLTSVVIPKGVTRIGASAFDHCKSLTSVVIPDSVKSIGESAFHTCYSMTGLVVPESVTDIADNAFKECRMLADKDDFVILQRRVYDYYGTEATVRIPEGVTSIGANVFWSRASMTCVVIPEGVTSIGASAFADCSNLNRVVIPESLTSIGREAFAECKSLTSVKLPESVTSVEEEAFCGCLELKTVEFIGAIPSFGAKVFQNCPRLEWKPEIYFTTQKLVSMFATGAPRENIKVSAYIQMYQSGKVWSDVVDAAAKKHADEIAAEIYALLQGSTKVSPKMGTNAAEFILKWRENIQTEQIKNLYRLLQDKKCKKAVELLESDIVTGELLKQEENTGEEQPQNPVEQLVRANWEYSEQEKKLKKYVNEGVKYKDSEEHCKPEIVIFVIAAYTRQVEKRRNNISIENYQKEYFPVHFEPLADQVAAELDREELLALLEKLTYEDNLQDCVIPLARYADEKRIKDLLARMRDWGFKTSIVSGRRNVILARGALMLNNNDWALLHMEDVGLLEEYAKTQKIDIDVLRDKVLAEVYFTMYDLDEQGHKVYDLGNKTVVAGMNLDLVPCVCDTVTHKVSKSIPKRGADPEKYQAAKKDFDGLKWMMKGRVHSHTNWIFHDFLTGRTREVEGWKQAYLTNPLLHQMAQLLVWNQGEKTFTLKGQEPIGSDGQAYTLTEEPVGVAHPIMMTKEELSAWQNYFSENHLKQPFEQVWEPKYDPDEITRNRYNGYLIPIYRLKNWDNRGFEYASMDQEWHLHYDQTDGLGASKTYTIHTFWFQSFTRKVNHIVFLLDKWTITERILQDDVAIVPLLGSFTAAQISEFIRLASEKGCTNVTALLLEYQNEHFGQFDPMAEFTLGE